MRSEVTSVAQPRKNNRKNAVSPEFSHRLLQKAFMALWKYTDNEGVCKGNGKIPTLRQELGLTEAQANHVVLCLHELGLLSWNGKPGRGATYRVAVEVPTITAKMAENVIATVGQYPKAKSAAPATRRSRKSQAASPAAAEPALGHKVQDLIAAAERLLQEVQSINEARLQAIADSDQLRQENDALRDQIAKLNTEIASLRAARVNNVSDLMARIDSLLEQESLVTAPRPSSQTH